MFVILAVDLDRCTLNDVTLKNPILKSISSRIKSFKQVSVVKFNKRRNEPLGITFESSHLRLLAANDFKQSTSLYPSAVVKSLPLLGSTDVFPGSFLVAINGQSTLRMSFESTIEYLKSVKNKGEELSLSFLNASESISPLENAKRFKKLVEDIYNIDDFTSVKSLWLQYIIALVKKHGLEHIKPEYEAAFTTTDIKAEVDNILSKIDVNI